MDRQSKINLYFLSSLLLAGLIFLSVITNKDVRYSRFDLSIAGNSYLDFAPLFAERTPTIAPSSSNTQYTSYEHLAISWWADKVAAYKVDDMGLWFKVTPTMNGDIVLTNPDDDTRLADVGFDIRNQRGQTVQVLVPGEWYKIKQYGQSYTVKFQWDK